MPKNFERIQKMRCYSTAWRVALLLGVTTAAIPAKAQGPRQEGLRLIETAPNQRAWMGQSDIENLVAKTHAAGRCGGFMDVTDHPTAWSLPPKVDYSFEMLLSQRDYINAVLPS